MEPQNNEQATRRRKVLMGSALGVLTVLIGVLGELGVAYLNSPAKPQTKPEPAVTFTGPVAIDRSDRRSDDHSDDHSVTNSNNSTNTNNSVLIDKRRDDHSDRSVTNQIDQSVHTTTVVPQQTAPAPQRVSPPQVAPRAMPTPVSRVAPQVTRPEPSVRSGEPEAAPAEVALLQTLENLKEHGLVAAERCATLSECEAEYGDWYAKSCAALRKLDAYVRQQYDSSEHFETDFKFQSPMTDLSMFSAAEQLDLFKRSFHVSANLLSIPVSKTKQIRLTASAY